MSKVTSLDDLRRACISFAGDDPDAEDVVGSTSIDLETSGWTFPGYERDKSKNWHFETLRAEIEGQEAGEFRIRVRCRLRNEFDDSLITGQGDFVAIATIGAPPRYDHAAGCWRFQMRG